MNTTNQRSRTLSLVLMVLSAVFAVVALLSIIGIWIAASAISNTAVRWLTAAENAITLADTNVQRLDNRLAAAQERIEAMQDRVKQAGTTVEEANLLRIALDQLIGDDLMPILDDTRTTINSIVQIAENIQDTIDAVNAIPFVNVEIPGAETFREVREQVITLVTAVQQVRSDLQNRKSDTVQQIVSTITSFTGRALNIISEVRTPLQQGQTRLATLGTQVTQLKAELPGRITLVAILLTIVFGWFLISQLILFGVGWALRSGKTLLGIQIASVEHPALAQ